MNDRYVTKKRKKNKKKASIFTKIGEYDYKILVAVLLLLLIGIVMVFSASAYYSLFEKNDILFFLKKEIFVATIGIIVFMITMRIDYHIYKKLTGVLIILTVILLVAVQFKGAEINGAQRWFYLGPISIQPSEIAKYAVVFLLAIRLNVSEERLKSLKYGTISNFAWAAVFAGAVFLQKNLSITAVIMMVAFIMIFVAGGNRKHLSVMVVVGIVVGTLGIVTSDYRLERVLSFTNPWKDSSEAGFQLLHSFYAIGTGGVFGEGLGNSIQKTLYMPEPHNDFIFAIIAEELGYVGCLVVIGLFLLLILSGLSVAARAKENYGKLLATGIISIIAIQALINIAVVSGSMPVTGVPLPFISYGGTSLIINLAAMGVLLNISKQCNSEYIE